MKNYILAVLSVYCLAATTAAGAWHDHGQFPGFRDHPGGYGEYRPAPGRSGFGSRTRVHVERGSYAGGYLLRVYTRGIKPQDIEVDADRGRIRLRSEMSAQRDWRDEYRRSRMAGFSSFARSIPLPYDADASRLEVTATDEVLEIRIPRR